MTGVRLAFDADNYPGETSIWPVADRALFWFNCEHPPALHR
jgi:hypothetical protein